MSLVLMNNPIKIDFSASLFLLAFYIVYFLPQVPSHIITFLKSDCVKFALVLFLFTSCSNNVELCILVLLTYIVTVQQGGARENFVSSYIGNELPVVDATPSNVQEDANKPKCGGFQIEENIPSQDQLDNGVIVNSPYFKSPLASDSCHPAAKITKLVNNSNNNTCRGFNLTNSTTIQNQSDNNVLNNSPYFKSGMEGDTTHPAHQLPQNNHNVNGEPYGYSLIE